MFTHFTVLQRTMICPAGSSLSAVSEVADGLSTVHHITPCHKEGGLPSCPAGSSLSAATEVGRSFAMLKDSSSA